jgi:hypothetical protein
MSCSVATRSSNERTSDKSAKYDIKVHASDNGPPEGLSRMLDIFESCIPKPADLDRLADKQEEDKKNPEDPKPEDNIA